MSTLGHDLRHGLRSWLRSPGLALVATTTLALGIGANTAIFSVVNGVLLRAFPYREPERMVFLWERNLARGFPFMYVAPPNFTDWAERSASFEAMGAFTTRDFTLLTETPERVPGGLVSAAVFPMLGVSPVEGRWFVPEEDAPGARKVVLVSHGFSERRFGRGGDIVGTELVLDGEPHTIVGVMPEGFTFPPPIALEGNLPDRQPELWAPLAVDYASGQRGAHYLTVLGRLREGVSLSEARSELATIASALAEAYPESNRGWDARVVPLSEQVTGAIRPALLVLLAAVGLVLLIACGNVANLLLTRGVGRQSELAVRASLGASQGRLAAQLLAESVLLALAGGALGVAFAYLGVKLLLSLAPSNLPRLSEVRFDGTVLGLTIGVSLLAGILFGLAPAVQLRAARLFDCLKDRDPRGASGSARRLRNALVVAEVALALVLLVGAGLLLRSFLRLRAVEPGFRAENVVTVRTTLPRTRYGEPTRRVQFLDEVLSGLRSHPDVAASGAINEMPLATDRQGTSVQIEGEPEPPSGQERQTNFAVVSPGYFRAMAIPLIRGRTFGERDREGLPEVVVVNRAFARRYLPGEDPIGKRIFLGMSHQVPRQIVGVVGDVRHVALREEAVPNVYAPYLQYPRALGLTLVLRTTAEPKGVVRSARTIIQDVDPALPLFDARTLQTVLDESLSAPRFSSFLLAAFAAMALALAAVGLYGVMSYTVSQRIPELGLRLALGAQARDVLRLVLRAGARLALVGLAIGLTASLALTRLLSSFLYGVDPLDLPTFALVPIGLFAVALLACYLPARRATRVDPIEALRYE